jgi:hypothetical protein
VHRNVNYKYIIKFPFLFATLSESLSHLDTVSYVNCFLIKNKQRKEYLPFGGIAFIFYFFVLSVIILRVCKRCNNLEI